MTSFGEPSGRRELSTMDLVGSTVQQPSMIRHTLRDAYVRAAMRLTMHGTHLPVDPSGDPHCRQWSFRSPSSLSGSRGLPAPFVCCWRAAGSARRVSRSPANRSSVVSESSAGGRRSPLAWVSLCIRYIRDIRYIFE